MATLFPLYTPSAGLTWLHCRSVFNYLVLYRYNICISPGLSGWTILLVASSSRISVIFLSVGPIIFLQVQVNPFPLVAPSTGLTWLYCPVFNYLCRYNICIIHSFRAFLVGHWTIVEASSSWISVISFSFYRSNYFPSSTCHTCTDQKRLCFIHSLLFAPCFSVIRTCDWMSY